MTNTNSNLTEYAAVYLYLSRGQRKIALYLFFLLKNHPTVFPNVSSIAKFAGISERAVQKFFAKLDKIKENVLLIERIPRFRRSGGNTSNEYRLSNNFISALEWLNSRGFLNSPKNKAERILRSMQKERKAHPAPPQKVHPSYKDSSNKDIITLGRPVWQHHLLLGINSLDARAHAFAKKHADFDVIEARDACKYQAKRRTILNFSAYFMGTLKNKAKRKSI